MYTSFPSSVQKTCEESKSGQNEGRKEALKRQMATEWRKNEEGRLLLLDGKTGKGDLTYWILTLRVSFGNFIDHPVSNL